MTENLRDPHVVMAGKVTERVKAMLGPLGYGACRVCGIYAGKLHLGSVALWQIRLARARASHTGADQLSAYSLESCRAHLDQARAAAGDQAGPGVG